MRPVAILLSALIALGSSCSAAAQTQIVDEVETLRGVDTMEVSVSASSLRNGDVIDTSSVRTAVELQLRQLGITVLSPFASTGGSLAHFGVVDVDVSALEIIPHGRGQEGYAFCVSVELAQVVRLLHVTDSTTAFAPTWEARKSVELVGQDRPLTAAVVDELHSSLSELANAWLTANPRR